MDEQPPTMVPSTHLGDAGQCATVTGVSPAVAVPAH